MKKISRRSFLSACAMLSATGILSACGGSASSTASSTGVASATSSASGAKEFQKMKIAMATNNVAEDFVLLKNALDNTVGPALNIEFMYSEALSDAGQMTTFIENAYASGCNGVFCTLSNSIDQAAATCNELGMYFVGINSSGANENQDMPYYVSVTGASAEGYGLSYATVLKNVVDDGKEHSVLILSGAACYGATSFIEGTAGCLEALQDVYGLTYNQPTDELATVSVQTDAENDKGIKITVFPGMADLATLVSPLLQTGDYDVIVGTTDISASLSVAVDEVEKALGMDIKFISRVTFSDTISTAFNSTDSQGSPVMDGVVCQGTYEYLASVLLLRNAFDGYADNMRDNGKCSRVAGMAPLAICTADEYNTLSSSDMPYSFVTVDELQSLCGPDVTWQDIDEFGASLTTENILEKFA